jgi:protein-S-isoprenylcysteine O-methyltransferase Ste14
MSLEDIISQSLVYENWVGVASWFIMFATFIFFLPFNRKSSIKPASTYLAFIVASAFEMFGIPLSMYALTWVFGATVPKGLFWGHTLEGVIGYWGMYVGFGFNVVGGFLIYEGWKVIYREYWSKNAGEGRLVTEGVYSMVRHPQYTGFILMSLGLLVHWATLPLLIMWPLLVLQYYRLARREETEMVAQFGDEYMEYMERVPMFLPRLL